MLRHVEMSQCILRWNDSPFSIERGDHAVMQPPNILLFCNCSFMDLWATCTFLWFCSKGYKLGGKVFISFHIIKSLKPWLPYILQQKPFKNPPTHPPPQKKKKTSPSHILHPLGSFLFLPFVFLICSAGSFPGRSSLWLGRLRLDCEGHHSGGHRRHGDHAAATTAHAAARAVGCCVVVVDHWGGCLFWGIAGVCLR